MMPMTTLAGRTCVPCRGDVPPLSESEIQPLLAQIDSAWEIERRDTPKFTGVNVLKRTYPFNNFAQALSAAVRVGAIAEEQQHHPDLLVAWGKLGVEIWTHKIGGLTESDFIFAAKCDDLLSR